MIQFIQTSNEQIDARVQRSFDVRVQPYEIESN